MYDIIKDHEDYARKEGRMEGRMEGEKAAYLKILLKVKNAIGRQEASCRPMAFRFYQIFSLRCVIPIDIACVVATQPWGTHAVIRILLLEEIRNLPYGIAGLRMSVAKQEIAAAAVGAAGEIG